MFQTFKYNYFKHAMDQHQIQKSTVNHPKSNNFTFPQFYLKSSLHIQHQLQHPSTINTI